MKKVCFILCVIIFTSTLLACFSASSSPKNDIETSTETTEIVIGSDRDIVLKENHPKLWDDAKKATGVWGNEITAEKVVLERRYDSIYKDNHILELTINEKELNGEKVEYIDEVYFYFSRFDETVSFEEALDIVATYLPKEIMEQYYSDGISFSETTGTKKYVKEFELKDGDNSNNPNLATSFGICIWVDDNENAVDGKVGYGLFYPNNKENAEDWDYNFLEN